MGGGSTDVDRKDNTRELFNNFIRKYPDAVLVPEPAQHDSHMFGDNYLNPATIFINKQREYMDKGYTQGRAFEMVEEEMAMTLQKGREETRLRRGLAYDNMSRSYLDRYE